MLNSGDALERLAAVDTVIFDKTGTLTLPQPSLVNASEIAPETLALAGALALSSRHPLARAIAAAAGARAPIAAEEFPGEGVSALHDGEQLKLGSVAWRHAEAEAAEVAARWPDASLIAFERAGRRTVFAVRQAVRSDAREVVARLKALGFRIEILSGDRDAAVVAIARELGVSVFRSGMRPTDKIAYLKAAREKGRKVAMIGDGLNDAPALAAANVSISPISAAHLTQAQADAVFLGERLSPVADAFALARKAKSLMVQNLALSVLYNLIAVPVAILGFATPLIAAAAMSGSSVLVTLNAMRERRAREPPDERARLSGSRRAGARRPRLAGFLWAMKSGQFDDLDGALAGDLGRRPAGLRKALSPRRRRALS